MPGVREIPNDHWEQLEGWRRLDEMDLADDHAAAMTEANQQVAEYLGATEVAQVIEGGGEIALKRHKTWPVVEKFKRLVTQGPVDDAGAPTIKPWQRGKITTHLKLEKARQDNRLRELGSKGVAVALPNQKPLR